MVFITDNPHVLKVVDNIGIESVEGWAHWRMTLMLGFRSGVATAFGDRASYTPVGSLPCSR